MITKDQNLWSVIGVVSPVLARAKEYLNLRQSLYLSRDIVELQLMFGEVR
jgi:hypothetical protein